jgi:phage tail-like protein
MYRCYPGDDVTFYTRICADESMSGFVLRVSMPEGLTPGDTRAPGGAVPQVGLGTGTRYLVWNVDLSPEGGLTRAPDGMYEYQIVARVEPTHRDLILQSRATVTQRSGEEAFSAGETVAIAVSAKGRYIKNLPAFYYRDDFMGRFLMLFESFWDPIETQIAHIYAYFDPKMTPSRFLPWLASWLGLLLDERLPEVQQRRLLLSATWLLRRRGTKPALKRYLEIYTDGEAQIREHRASNFKLGPEARLGPGIALGTENRPHSFSVLLRVPPISTSGRESERAHLELERRLMIESIIESEKPAHTTFTLQIEQIAS